MDASQYKAMISLEGKRLLELASADSQRNAGLGRAERLKLYMSEFATSYAVRAVPGRDG